MKNILKSVVIMGAFFIGMWQVNAASAGLTTSKTSVLTSQTTKVSLIINADARVRGGQFNLGLNNSNFEIVSVVGASGLNISKNGNLYLSLLMEADYSIPSGSAIAVVTLRAKSSTVGATSVLTASNIGVTLAGSYETVPVPSKSLTLRIATPPKADPVVPKSTDNSLKELTTSIAGLEFNPNTLVYNATVDSSVKSVNITALANDSKATVEITGNNDLKLGKNVILVKVTAEDESVKTYTINVTKSGSNNNFLLSLKVEGYDINPVFNKDTKRYDVKIDSVEIDKLDIEAIAEDLKSTVKIIGNEGLIEGRNIIKIIVTSETGEENTYNLVVNLGSELENAKDTNNNLLIISNLIIIAIAGIVITVILVKKKKNEKDL
ncbi:MAG: cadherin-like beta sandwich domain-containing protein [Bacilli bacterium]|nr:cadherin-like beta sandwich domain-containing protein [Bacilli bacterium]MDD4733544.1 cadherin-like beta sandwich domain-containing protein [Bacilli bacterium]